MANKPCPFCGGTNLATPPGIAIVVCGDCEASGPEGTPHPAHAIVSVLVYGDPAPAGLYAVALCVTREGEPEPQVIEPEDDGRRILVDARDLLESGSRVGDKGLVNVVEERPQVELDPTGAEILLGVLSPVLTDAIDDSQAHRGDAQWANVALQVDQHVSSLAADLNGALSLI